MRNFFQDYDLIQRSGLFDAAYYYRANPQLLQNHVDALTHYLEVGARTGVNPSQHFDTSFYLRQCRQLGLDPQNPLLHYIQEGRTRGIKPTSGTSLPAANGTLAGQLERGTLLHSAAAGLPEELSPFAAVALHSGLLDQELVLEKLSVSAADPRAAEIYLQIPVPSRPNLSYLFDRDFYAQRYPDVSEARVDPLLHFVAHGRLEDRSPNPWIDIHFIRSMDPLLLSTPFELAELLDLLRFNLADPGPYFSLSHYRAQVGKSLDRGSSYLEHFLKVGCLAGLRPNPLFDPGWYCRQLPGVFDLYAAIRHFVLRGDREGRAPSPEFSGRRYLERYLDVSDAAIPPLAHYLTHGRKEGRSFLPALPDVQAGHVLSPDAATEVSVDYDGAPTLYAAMEDLIRGSRQRKQDDAKLSALRTVSCRDLTQARRKLSFRKVKDPKVTVLIPVYNEIAMTFECLLSLSRHKCAHSFEILIADDASDDPQAKELAAITNVLYQRRELNTGFLRNCNQAYDACRGEYVLLLNNDAQLLPGALDALIASLERDPRVAAVGPKILYPSGRLQEAGCALGETGVATMVGLFQDPAAAQFNYERDVHYCSGAALLVRRAQVGATLFDDQFSPAYCEDADLCLRLIAQGFRIRYCPQAQVAHHLSVSTNKQSVTRRLQQIAVNQMRLTHKWGALLENMNRVRVLSFYLPQFHPTPENDFNWGRGFTEWTNVSKARPKYANHYQPHLPADLGFYDLRVKETVERQCELARRYGIDGFCVYYYNFGTQRALDRAFESIVADAAIDFRYCVCWANENWTRHWDGGEKRIIFEQKYDDATQEAIVADALRYARDPRYLKVNDRPMFAVYRPMLLPDPRAFAQRCRNAFRAAGFPEVYLMFVESMETARKAVTPAELGFDAAIEFPPQGNAVEASERPREVMPDFAGTIYDYPKTAARCVTRAGLRGRRHPTVFPGWDNTPRQPTRGDSFISATPEAFQAYCEAKLEELHQMFVGEERLLFVNAWNEWAEGAHLEPDQRYGHRWLEALHNARLSRSLL